MAGVYTDNQPDFSFLAPGETKTFSQYWYPIQQMGVPTKANQLAALRVEDRGQNVHLALCVSEEFPGASISFDVAQTCVAQWKANLIPGKPFAADAELPVDLSRDDFAVQVRDSSGSKILCYSAFEFRNGDAPPPEPASEPPQPSDVANTEELFLIGQHLAQYRHATRSPVPYCRKPFGAIQKTAARITRLASGISAAVSFGWPNPICELLLAASPGAIRIQPTAKLFIISA